MGFGIHNADPATTKSIPLILIIIIISRIMTNHKVVEKFFELIAGQCVLVPDDFRHDFCVSCPSGFAQ